MSEKIDLAQIAWNAWDGKHNLESFGRIADVVMTEVLLREHDRLQATYESIVLENKRLREENASLAATANAMIVDARTLPVQPTAETYSRERVLRDIEFLDPDLHATILAAQPTAETSAERRRYALLQAAAVLWKDSDDIDRTDQRVGVTVTAAEVLLAEIEKRTEGK